MSQVDFSQDALDNASLYIAVLPIGEITASLYSSVLDTLNSLLAYRSPDGKNNLLHFKFLSVVPKWGHGNTEWSQFTPYKQIYGVLAVAQCFDEEEAILIESEFKQATTKYKHTLCDSKCIVFCEKNKLEEHLDFRRGFSLIEADMSSYSVGGVVVKKEIATILGDFFLAIYGVLMSKLKDITNNYLASGSKDIPSLISPFERTNDGEIQKSYSRKHWMARLRKHVADMYLVAGCVQEAISQYTTVVESLRSHNDWLWLGSAYEGLSCAAIVMKMKEQMLQGDFVNGLNWKNSPRMNHRPLHNVNSRTSGRISPVIKRPAYEDTKCGELGASIEEPVSVNEQEEEEEMFEENTQNGYDGEEEENEVEHEDATDSIMQQFLQKDFVVDKFTRALHYYGKAGAIAGVSHIEALLKFSKFLVLEKRYPLASEILWRIFKVVSYVTEEEKVLLYKTLATTYSLMGFKRKAAMMIHYAALQSFKLCQNYSHPQALYQAYELLKECLPGFSLSLDVDDDRADEDDKNNKQTSQLLPKGWPVIQAKVLKDLVLVTKYMKQNASAVRLMCVLLQSLHMHLSSRELEEITSLLEQSATESQENNNIVPFLTQKIINQPVPLTDIPKVRSFKPLDLPDNLYPHRYPGYVKKEADVDTGPFIFSSLRLHKKKKSSEVYWVEGSAVEVSIIIMNPLPFDIKVENMCIRSEGVTMETVPFGLVLSPDYEPHHLTLISIPRGTGELKLLGYSAKVFSVESKCTVNIVDHPIIHVIPSLPVARIRLLGPASIKPYSSARNRDSVVSIMEGGIMLEMMDGESSQLELAIENSADNQPVTTMKIKFHSDDCDLCSMSFDEDELQNSLPLGAGQSTKLSVKAHASMPASFKIVWEDRGVNSPDGGNFFPRFIQPIADSPDLGEHANPPSPSNKPRTLPGGVRRPTRRMFSLHRGRESSDSQIRGRRRPNTTDDVLDIRIQPTRASSANVTRHGGSPQLENRLSIISNSSSMDSLALEGDSQPQTLPVYKLASAEFELEYTGGPGADQGYYRKTKLCITTRVLPTFHFSQFDVMPCTEVADKFVLSFNAANVTGNPMELHCAVYQSPLNGVLSDKVSQTHCWTINGSCSKRVRLELKKFILAEERNISKQDVVEKYSRYLTDLVRLTWRCPSLGKECSKSISAFVIPLEMLKIMKHVPVQLGVTMNNISADQRGPRKFPINNRINFTITLSSIHSSTLTNLLLMVQPYQENCGGSHDTNLSGKLVYSGSLRVQVPELLPRESYQCNLSLIFMCKGIYHISVKCSQQAVDTYELRPSRNTRNFTGSSQDILENNLLDRARQDARTNQLVCVSPILPSCLRSHSPLPSLHSPTPVYEPHSPAPSPQGYTLQDTLVGPLTTLEIY